MASKKIGALLVLLFSGVSAFADAPSRVVSVNLCTDQLAMTLATPEQLVSVSYLARDPMSSTMAEEAAAYEVNHAQIEEIVLLKPDLVLTSEWTSPLLISMLDKFDIPYARFDLPHSLEEVPSLILQMGEALGHEEKSEDLVADFNKRKAELLANAPKFDILPTIASYGPNGWVGGASGLGSDIMRVAGFHNIAGDYGLEYGGYMPLETIVVASPDVLLTSTPWPASSRSESLLAHPALLAMSGDMMKHAQTDASWGCGIPKSLNALEDMIELARELESKGS